MTTKVFKKKTWKLKFDNAKTEIVTKLKKSNWDKTPKLKF